MAEIVQHPSASNTPFMTLAQATGIAQNGQMTDVCILYTDPMGQMHIAATRLIYDGGSSELPRRS